MRHAGTRIIEATDDDFAALLQSEHFVRAGLASPPGGVDTPEVVTHIRGMAADLHRAGYPGWHWLIVADGEVVGLCGVKAPPTPQGEIEIGYGVAASRRCRGHAGAAVRGVIEAARRDLRIRAIVALTATDNIASQRVLALNGFEQAGTRSDPVDGRVLLWRRIL